MTTVAYFARVKSMKLKDLVISIPHSSTFIPEEIRSRMPHDDSVVLRDVDHHTERLYRYDGATMVIAKHARVIADPNRAPDEMYTEGKQRGDGVITLQQADGIDLFTEDPSIEEMTQWIHTYHEPFHTELRTAMKSAQFLIDGHSLLPFIPAWRKSIETHTRADISLGNREYCSCSAETMQFFREQYEALGYSVTLNDPYPGRYILGVYANRLRTPGIQIEINRGLYMNNETFEPFNDVIERMNAEFVQIVDDFVAWYVPETHSSDRPMTDLSEGM